MFRGTLSVHYKINFEMAYFNSNKKDLTNP